MVRDKKRAPLKTPAWEAINIKASVIPVISKFQIEVSVLWRLNRH